MNNNQIKEFCQLTPELEQLSKQALNTMNLSARAYMRALKVARTIADLENSKDISTKHFTEALQYRVQNATV